MLRLKLALGAILLLAVPVTLADAQTSVPTVAVTAANGNVTLAPSGPIGAGPTRFTYRGGGEFDLVTLRAGVSIDDLRRTVARSEEAALNLVFVEASSTGTAVTVDLRPNTTYVVAGGEGKSQGLTSFTTGGPNGATAPKPAARIRMVDYGFKGPGVLPRKGRVRFDNAGTTFHFAIAFPLRRGASAKKVGRALRSGNERALGRVAAGQPIDLQGLISQGTTNVDEVNFKHKGRVAMVCFFGGHNRLGMYRVFRVR